MAANLNGAWRGGAQLTRNATNTPLVTIAMPVFNAGRHLRLAVLSVAQQTLSDWELLILDDGSTDDALKSIEDIVDDRIHVFRDGVNKGIAARLNQGIDLASAPYFARMDSDDVSYPHRLERQLRVLQRDRQLDLLSTRAIVIDESNRPIGQFPHALTHEAICRRPWRGFHFPHPTWMGRTDWFRQHRYAIPAPDFCEDQELLLRSYRTSAFQTLDDILLAYRVRDRVDPHKLLRARKSMWRLQSRQFRREADWGLLTLATMMFMAKTTRDICLGKTGNVVLQAEAPSLPWRTQWDAVLSQLEPRATAR